MVEVYFVKLEVHFIYCKFYDFLVPVLLYHTLPLHNCIYNKWARRRDVNFVKSVKHFLEF